MRWRSIENLRVHLDPLVAELGRMPTRKDLEVRERSDLINAVGKFGGLRKVAGALGYSYEGRDSWATLGDLHTHLEPIVAELGRMPTSPELETRGRRNMADAINKFGGFPRVAAALGYRYEGQKSWDIVEDLRPHLDLLVTELGRMPTQDELLTRKRADLAGAIAKFGGFPKVAETLSYPYTYALSLQKRAHYKELEAAIVELHTAQQLSAGQVMVILRHAGLLSRRDFAEVAQKLQSVGAIQGAALAAVLDQLADVLDPVAEDRGAGISGFDLAMTDWTESDPDESVQHTPNGDELSSEEINGHLIEPMEQVAAVPTKLGRQHDVEIKELRGWSAVGNLLDPAPALIRLSVGRLKSAFYGFANEKYRTLAAPSLLPTPEDIARLSTDLHDAAFGTYGEYLTNDLVRQASHTYAGDLARSYLLPRATNSRFKPRLYQLDGARFIAERVVSDAVPFGLLLDQPGMGKSLTTLWALAAAGVQRFALVAPLTVKHEVWTLDTLRVAFPSLPAERVARGLLDALALPTDGAAVVLLHYQELLRHEQIGALVRPRPDGRPAFDALVFDEAHEVKERVAGSAYRGPLKRGAWLLRGGARACFGITATPLVNELSEPVSLLQLAKGQDDPEVRRQLRSTRVRDRVDVMEHLLADSLRRTKADVLFEIPTRTISTHPVTPTSDRLAAIEAFLARSRRAVANDLSAYRKLMLEAKLGWITDEVHGHRLAMTADGQPDPKVLVLCNNVDEVSERVYERLADQFGPTRIRHVNGGTPGAARTEALQAFRAHADSESGVIALVGTVGTIGVGVTLFDPTALVTPHRVIFADLPYTWAEFEQAVDRLHRVGQRLFVQVDVPVVNFGNELTRADGEPLKSFDGWVWDLIAGKQRLADQVLDAAFDVADYTAGKVQRAIRDMLSSLYESGGAVVAPAPPGDSSQAEHRRSLGRYRALPRARVAELFLSDRAASEQFLRNNDASPSATLAQRLVRERLGRWLDRRSVVVDLGCGSNPLRDLPCKVIGIDRHGVNGGRLGDMGSTELPDAEADFAVMSLSMWGTPADRLAYLLEAKRLLRPLGKLIIVEPSTPFGGAGTWQRGAGTLSELVSQLGMRLIEQREFTVDRGGSLVAFVVDNSSTPPSSGILAGACEWLD